jgi:hypothetical protein
MSRSPPCNRRQHLTTVLGKSGAGSQIVDSTLNLARNETRQEQRGSWFDYSGFVDRYIKGESHIVLRLRSRNDQEYLALIQREGWGGADIDHPNVAKPIELRVGTLTFAWSQGTATWRKTRGQQKTMLVYDVELVELPEQMAKASSLVWLDTVENISARLPRALYTSMSQTTIVLGTIPDWEVRVLYVWLSR